MAQRGRATLIERNVEEVLHVNHPQTEVVDSGTRYHQGNLQGPAARRDLTLAAEAIDNLPHDVFVCFSCPGLLAPC